MEVVPTSDGEEDDGVIWFRCPQCQGFLPKLSGSDGSPGGSSGGSSGNSSGSGTKSGSESGLKTEAESPPESSSDDSLPWDSPADMMAAREKGGEETVVPDPADLPEEAAVPVVGKKDKDKKKGDAEPSEPIPEYIALLAEKDQGDPSPYRPWETYEVGQCILHQAWEDCGVVVAKETLPGGREIIKCYFAEAGVVRLIEKAPR